MGKRQFGPPPVSVRRIWAVRRRLVLADLARELGLGPERVADVLQELGFRGGAGMGLGAAPCRTCGETTDLSGLTEDRECLDCRLEALAASPVGQELLRVIERHPHLGHDLGRYRWQGLGEPWA